jgi:hypothetical protein
MRVADPLVHHRMHTVQEEFTMEETLRIFMTQSLSVN